MSPAPGCVGQGVGHGIGGGKVLPQSGGLQRQVGGRGVAYQSQVAVLLGGKKVHHHDSGGNQLGGQKMDSCGAVSASISPTMVATRTPGPCSTICRSRMSAGKALSTPCTVECTSQTGTPWADQRPLMGGWSVPSPCGHMRRPGRLVEPATHRSISRPLTRAATAVSTSRRNGGLPLLITAQPGLLGCSGHSWVCSRWVDGGGGKVTSMVSKSLYCSAWA